MSARDWADVARVVIAEQGERVEAVDTWLATPLFHHRPTPQSLEEWAEDPAWLDEQERTLAALGSGA